MGVFISLWPIVFVTAAKFPVRLSAYMPKSCLALCITKSSGSSAFSLALANC